MKKTHNLIDFIKMYYVDSNIPMYLYTGESCTFSMPEQDDLTYPPTKYLMELFTSVNRISYIVSDYGSIFCALKIDAPKNSFLVFGPVTEVPYADSELQNLYRDYTAPNNLRQAFNHFLRKIPCLSLASLLKKCIFLNYCLVK